MNSSNSLSDVPEETSLSWVQQTDMLLPKKNSLPTSFPLFTSTVVDKWVKGNTVGTTIMRCLRAKLKLNPQQRKKVDEWMNTSRYVYNQAVATVRSGTKVNKFHLRDQLVTYETKKHHEAYQQVTQEIVSLHLQKKESIRPEEKQQYQETIETKKKYQRNLAKTLPPSHNGTLQSWELQTPKDIRAGAVEDLYTAYKGCFERLKKGQISHFEIGFRKKSNPRQSMLLPKSIFKNNKTELRLSPQFLPGNAVLKVGKRSWKELQTMEIEHDCRLVREKNEYFVMIPRKKEITESRQCTTYCGIDMGVRTFATVVGSQGIKEVNYCSSVLDKLNNKIDMLRIRPLRVHQGIRTRKRKMHQYERRKENMINELHWKTIRCILNENNLIFYGDIKSHGIVKDGKNKWLNRRFQDLKHCKFKQRLEEKCIERNRMLVLLDEHFTTKTCSTCGTLHDPGKSKVYQCSLCNKTMGRDVNAAKNILMKGMIRCI